MSSAMTDTPTREHRGGGRAYHSVLESHFDRIRDLRRQRMTWREIAARLESEHGLKVTLHAVYHFCRRRMRRPISWEEQSAPRPQAAPTETEAAVSSRTPVPARRPFLPTSTFRRPDPKQFNREDYP